MSAKRAALLYEDMVDLARRKYVDISRLRSAVGVWVWGALLRRDILAAPHALFKFMDTFDGRIVQWWPSARRELHSMAGLIMAM